jgi:hypothetical protein
VKRGCEGCDVIERCVENGFLEESGYRQRYVIVPRRLLDNQTFTNIGLGRYESLSCAYVLYKPHGKIMRSIKRYLADDIQALSVHGRICQRIAIGQVVRVQKNLLLGHTIV